MLEQLVKEKQHTLAWVLNNLALAGVKQGDVLTIKELAEKSGVGRNTIQKLVPYAPFLPYSKPNTKRGKFGAYSAGGLGRLVAHPPAKSSYERVYGKPKSTATPVYPLPDETVKRNLRNGRYTITQLPTKPVKAVSKKEFRAILQHQFLKEKEMKLKHQETKHGISVSRAEFAKALGVCPKTSYNYSKYAKEKGWVKITPNIKRSPLGDKYASLEETYGDYLKAKQAGKHKGVHWIENGITVNGRPKKYPYTKRGVGQAAIEAGSLDRVMLVEQHASYYKSTKTILEQVDDFIEKAKAWRGYMGQTLVPATGD